MSINYGLDLKKEETDRSPEDWVLGATSKSCLVEVPAEDRDKYLPVGEVQKGKEDFMDCASRSVINILEFKLNYVYRNDLQPMLKKWLEDNGYVNENGFVELSDRFVAMKSGTSRTGNSLKAPCDAAHSWGVIPKAMLPANKNMTWAEYHEVSDITVDMDKLGMEFIKRFKINYNIVLSTDFSDLLLIEPIDVGGYAWKFPNEEGVYQRNEKTFNHAFMIFGKPDFRIFDNYIDSFDGDWVKQLAGDYNFIPYGYRIYFSEINSDGVKKNWVEDMWNRIFLAIKSSFIPNNPTSYEK